MAQHHNEYRLSLLLSQATGNSLPRNLSYQQLAEWQDLKVQCGLMISCAHPIPLTSISYPAVFPSPFLCSLFMLFISNMFPHSLSPTFPVFISSLFSHFHHSASQIFHVYHGLMKETDFEANTDINVRAQK